MRALTAVAVLAVTAAVGCADPAEDVPKGTPVDYKVAAVVLYCDYGAVSKAQARGCQEHVTFGQVADRYVHGNKRGGDSLAAHHALDCLSAEAPDANHAFSHLRAAYDRDVLRVGGHAAVKLARRIRVLQKQKAQIAAEHLKVHPERASGSQQWKQSVRVCFQVAALDRAAENR